MDGTGEPSFLAFARELFEEVSEACAELPRPARLVEAVSCGERLEELLEIVQSLDRRLWMHAEDRLHQIVVAVAVAKSVEALRHRVDLSESRTRLNAAVSGSTLPAAAKTRLVESLKDRVMTAGQISQAISAELEYLDTLQESKDPQPSGITVGEEQVDRFRSAMYGMISGQKEVDGVRRFRSLHESHRAMIGTAAGPTEIGRDLMAAVAVSLPRRAVQHRWGNDPADQLREHWAWAAGKLRESAGTLGLRASLSVSTWAEAFGDSMRRFLIDTFNNSRYQWWRLVVSNVRPRPTSARSAVCGSVGSATSRRWSRARLTRA